MNFTQSFEEFSKGLGTMDLALYAGIGLVLWILFKDKLSPLQSVIHNLLNKTKTVVPSVIPAKEIAVKDSDLFFQLVESWKLTRDLAVKSKCEEAVKVADQMFPYLSPSVCSKEKTDA